MILLVLENQPNRKRAHFRAKIGSVSCLPSLHLLKVRSLRQTRSGSLRDTTRIATSACRIEHHCAVVTFRPLV